jgi:hypothetical protein
MQEMRLKYEGKVPREGTCGPTLLAFLTQKTVGEIIEGWSEPYLGYCSLRQLEKNFRKHGFDTFRIKPPVNRSFVLPGGVDRAIAKIKWGNRYSRWEIEEKNTHFVLLDKTSGELKLFDNTVGFFSENDEVARKYLKEGKIKKFLVI